MIITMKISSVELLINFLKNQEHLLTPLLGTAWSLPYAHLSQVGRVA